MWPGAASGTTGPPVPPTACPLRQSSAGWAIFWPERSAAPCNPALRPWHWPPAGVNQGNNKTRKRSKVPVPLHCLAFFTKMNSSSSVVLLFPANLFPIPDYSTIRMEILYRILKCYHNVPVLSSKSFHLRKDKQRVPIGTLCLVEKRIT